jgi:hypothetical protein
MAGNIYQLLAMIYLQKEERIMPLTSEIKESSLLKNVLISINKGIKQP